MASSLIPGCHVMSDLMTIREKGVLFTLLEPQCTVSSVLYCHFKLISIKYNLTIMYFRRWCMYKHLKQLSVILNHNPLHLETLILIFPEVVFRLSVTSIRWGLLDEWALCEGCFVYSCCLHCLTLPHWYQSRCYKI